MKAYKGFDKNLKCRDFQFEVGMTYEEDKAELCECGFHACAYPLDVFNYYPPAGNRFCEVELEGITDETSIDSKRVGRKITIVREMTIAELIMAAVAYAKDCSAANVSGCKGAANASGNHSAANASGDFSVANASGYCSAANASGYCSTAFVKNRGGIALASGYECKAKAGIGSAIVCTERGEWDGNGYPLVGIKAAIVDGETIKADTWYSLKNGEFVEAEDD